MPEISRFYGIIVMMNWRDHPPPHIHARYGDEEITVTLDNAMRIEGRIQRRALLLLLEWVDLHRAELLDNWQRAERREPLTQIDPL